MARVPREAPNLAVGLARMRARTEDTRKDLVHLKAVMMPGIEADSDLETAMVLPEIEDD